ncbi:MAG: ABC transporter ATP-binding protein [Desulforegulaceae bacterium]|nr:ABC transporter ATP-binding protein [Desulforegulaceae bacterium]
MSFKLVLPYFKEHFVKIISGILILLTVDFFQLLIPYLTKKAIDVITYNKNDFNSVLKVGLIIVLSGFLITFLRYWWRVFLIGTSRHIEKGIRDSLFFNIMNFKVGFFDQVKTGDIMARATSDLAHIRMAFGVGIIAFTDAVLLGSATIGIMFYLNPKLAGLALIPMPFIALSTRVLGKKMHDYHTDAQKSFSDLMENMRESFLGIRIIRVFNFEKFINKKVDSYSLDYFEKSLKRAVILSAIKPLMIFFLNLSLFIILFYGGFLVMEGKITSGDLVAFIQYLSLLAWPVMALGWMTNLMQRGIASLKRIEDILNLGESVFEEEARSEEIKKVEEISCENLWFSYENEEYVLKNINFSLKKGEMLGITGPPGSGKSTLAAIISGLYEPLKGSVKLNGKDLRTIKIKNLRQKITFMPQESFIFSGELKENIVLGQNYDLERLKNSIKLSCLESDLENMPQGLDSIVGERGTALSGGQKQRTAIARALYNPGDIIIFDDPISQVDSNTARFLIENLKSLSEDKILIVISNRISAILNAEKIMVLKNYEAENIGSHEYLLENNRFYKKSSKIQGVL